MVAWGMDELFAPATRFGYARENPKISAEIRKIQRAVAGGTRSPDSRIVMAVEWETVLDGRPCKVYVDYWTQEVLCIVRTRTHRQRKPESR